MKKSIKYAGIAAATLLAVAPVAAPVVSTTTAQAASTSTTTDTNYKNAAANFNSVFTNQTLDTLPKLATSLTGYADGQASVKYSDFADSDLAKANNIPSAANQTLLTGDEDVKAIVKVSGANTADDLTALDKADAGYTFSVQLTYVDSTGATVKTDPVKVTYSKTAATTQIKSANVTYTTPISVEYGSSVYDQQLSTSTDLKATDNSGNTVSGLTVKPDATLYNSYYAASNSDANNTFGDTTFDKSGATYYQRLNVTVASDSPMYALMNNAATDPSDYSITVNGNSTSSTFYETSSANGAKTFTVIRAINVGTKEAADWTTEDVDGVVTTKSDSAYYTLKNDDNDTVSNRALAKNTAWKTNAVRTNSNGDKQYRVATGEWIDANDVTFSDGSSSSEGAYTDEQALNGKVTLDGPSSFIYMLYNDNGESVSNRALAGDSAWYTDKKATNAAGVTVYHVATGEWVQAGSGVNYVAY